jgi:hypothetical protein
LNRILKMQTVQIYTEIESRKILLDLFTSNLSIQIGEIK